jgi:hypothetical protein
MLPVRSFTLKMILLLDDVGSGRQRAPHAINVS